MWKSIKGEKLGGNLKLPPNFCPLLLASLLLCLSACSLRPVLESKLPVVHFTESSFTLANGKTHKFSAEPGATTYFLIRHAEKANGDNPSLTEAGVQRSARLAAMLKEAGVTQIFSTNYKRTFATAEPLSNVLRIPVTTYDEKDLTVAVKVFSESTKTGKALIVGHSNTTPFLVNYFMGKEVAPKMAELEYDHLYVVVLRPGKRAKWWSLKY